MRIKTELILAISLVLSLSACARTIKLETTFDPAQAAYINTKGKATINGQAFLRRNDGVVVYAAGSSVSLIPATTYAVERIGALYGAGKQVQVILPPKIEGDDPQYRTFTRTSKANGEGRFTFAEVAPGNYFMTTSVQWCVPGAYGSCITQGGSLMENITITGSERAEVIMNGQ